MAGLAKPRDGQHSQAGETAMTILVPRLPSEAELPFPTPWATLSWLPAATHSSSVRAVGAGGGQQR